MAQNLIARHPRTSMTHHPPSVPTWHDDTHIPQPTNAQGHASSHRRALSFNLSDLEEIEFALPNDADDSDSSAREPIQVHPTFTKDAAWPGTLKIIVEATTFWTHKDVLVFASPFFEAALSGCWSETNRPVSISSVITIAQPPAVPSSSSSQGTALENASIVTSPHPEKPPLDASSDDEEDDSKDPDKSRQGTPFIQIFNDLSDSDSEPNNPRGIKTTSECNAPSVDLAPSVSSDSSSKEKARATSLELLQGRKTVEGASDSPPVTCKKRPRSRFPDAVIHLKEEKATIFHDFLKFVYPHLECTITWYNVEGLMNISHKLVVPALQQKCLNFLLTHAAGKPIKAMRIAELFEEDELYREASRFVLENPGGWADWEMNTLSSTTLLKLEKRRNWFLERVIKLGLVSIAKEYTCCATCPEPTTCARALDEKFRQNYLALFRFGPAQPSMVYRYLRSLEGVSPPLLLTQLSCQMFAKNWIASLFDRMFTLGVHVMAPLSGHGVVAAPGTGVAGPRRHFLFCTLKDDKDKKRATGAGAGRPNRRAFS